jgi:oligopeptide transport system substrate-binding protein
VPGVAQSWEVSEGGRKYLFHLRDDLHWSDGAPLTAEDFEYAWKRVLDPSTGSPVARLLYDVKGAKAFHRGDVGRGEVGVRALDELSLAVELEGPTGFFLHLLAHYTTYPVPRHVLDAHGGAWTEPGNLTTNGPFRLETWDRGVSMVLARNPGYTGQFRGNLDRVELSLLADPSAALEMYEADDLDIMYFHILPPAEMDRVRQRHAGEYVSGPTLNTEYVGFDARRPPFDDPRVRRAFVLATDKETLADVVLGGYVSPAMGGLIPPGMPGHSPGIALPYDPDQARQLLAEAGYPGGRGIPVLELPTRRGHEPMDEYLQAQWRENLGLEITWVQMEWRSFLEHLFRGTPRIWCVAWAADYPDPDNFLRAGTWKSYTGWQSKAFDGLVEGARRVMNQGERIKLYQEADRILVEKAVIMPLSHGRFHLLVKPWVKRYPASVIGGPFWKDIVIEPH